MKKVFTFLILVFSVFTHSFAQSGGFAGSYSRMGFGPRIVGIGNAYTAGTSQGFYGQYNPALSGFVENSVTEVHSAVMSFDRSMHSLGFTLPLPPSAGINFGLIYAGVNNIDGRSTSGYHTGFFSAYELQFQTSFGVRVTSKTNIGAGVKFNIASYNDNVKDATAIGFDIGLLYTLSPTFQFGLAAQDLISTYVWDTQELYGSIGSNQQNDRFPTRLKAGVQKLFPSYKLAFTADAEKMVVFSKIKTTTISTRLGKPLVLNSTENLASSTHEIRLGLAWEVQEYLTLRTGWQFRDLENIASGLSPAAGFSLNIPFNRMITSVDYAYVIEPAGTSAYHLFGFRLML